MGATTIKAKGAKPSSIPSVREVPEVVSAAVDQRRKRATAKIAIYTAAHVQTVTQPKMAATGGSSQRSVRSPTTFLQTRPQIQLRRAVFTVFKDAEQAHGRQVPTVKGLGHPPVRNERHPSFFGF